MAGSALLSLLKHCLISSEGIETEVWPAVLKRVARSTSARKESSPWHSPPQDGGKQAATGWIAEDSSSQFIIELVNKMAPWVGCELSERLIVPFLETLSEEPDICIRRFSAFLFGTLSSLVSTEVSETRLVPSFLKLCSDPQWVVRQSCAEVFMSVSCKVSLSARKNLLAPVFAKLLTDETKRVQLSAFESLGPFITTLADPSITSLAYLKGDLVLTYKVKKRSFMFKLALKPSSWNITSSLLHSGDEIKNDIFDLAEDDPDPDDPPSMTFRKESSSGSFLTFHSRSMESGPSPRFTGSSAHTRTSESSPDSEYTETDPPDSWSTDPDPEARSPGPVSHEGGEGAGEFNTWQFWREPLPSIVLSDEDNVPPTVILTSDDIDATETDLSKSACDLEFVDSIIKEFKELNNLKTGKSPEVNNDDEEIPVRISSRDKSKVPRELIDLFVSMPDRKLATNLATPDLATHCAYNLPAVALTLGRDNWDLLKPAYETLATDTQWKVRRIVACSIHELADIVGEDVATQDLVPIFSGFIKDLDVVRIGALKHLAAFLRLVRPAGRNMFLPRLTEFLMTDYEWNWRFRKELAEQLHQSLGLFSPADTCHHLGPVIMSLLLDKVAAVRKIALALVTELVSHVSIDVTLLRSLLAELAEQLAHSSRWNRRQTFAYLCCQLLDKRVLSEDMFARDVLPHLLDLSWDPIVNVRIAVARAVATNVITYSYFSDEQSPHHEVLMSVLKRLQSDKDRDVRYFATFHPPSSESNQEDEEEAQTEGLDQS